MEVLAAVAVAVLAGGALALLLWRQQERRRVFQRAAAAIGLTYSRNDLFLTSDLPFRLFQLGDGGKRIENVVWGTLDDVELRLFDYAYEVGANQRPLLPSVDDQPTHQTTHWKHFTCALAATPARLPEGIRIEREGVLSRVAGHLGFADIEFESEEFNRRYKVSGCDQKMAFGIVDARMMQWLTSLPIAASFELEVGYVLVWMPKLPDERVLDALNAARQFVAHVPSALTGAAPPPPW